MKLGIIVDSSCGLTKVEANAKGWGFLPLIMNINGKDLQDGIDIDSKTFYSQLSIDDSVRTSATPPALILDLFEEFSKSNDLVIVYGLSKELSSQTNNMKMFAKDFPNIHVVDSTGVAEMIVRDLEVIEKMNNDKVTSDEIKNKIDQLSHSQWGIAVPETLKWLVKGGRVSSSVAGMANLLKIVPIIKFENGKLEKHGVGRVFRKSINNAAAEVEEIGKDELIILHGENTDINDIHKSMEETLDKKVEVKYFPPIIALHTGPGVVAIITRKK